MKRNQLFNLTLIENYFWLLYFKVTQQKQNERIIWTVPCTSTSPVQKHFENWQWTRSKWDSQRNEQVNWINFYRKVSVYTGATRPTEMSKFKTSLLACLPCWANREEWEEKKKIYIKVDKIKVFNWTKMSSCGHINLNAKT